ncbi:MAG: hypothetical protein V7670_17370, partial [Maribacter arcticus]|uniref:beta strand repeat-containing protein n=1 Tax=Maribacter arcticus TaxID=561365 RepID=UPI003AB9AFA7
MKAIILFILFIMLTIPTVFGQIKIGDNPQNIDPASVLELESTSKVLVITRVSTLEMEAITPQRGGIVYNIDTECINYYDGTQWVNLCDAVNFTITNDPIINNRATIEITQTASGYNLEVAKNGILGDNIVDGGIGPDDIQDNSITQDKLAAESVGSSEIRQNAVGSDEIRDGSIAPSDIANFIPGQVLTTDENGIVQWEDGGNLMGSVGDEITITGSGTPASPLEISEGIQLNISNNTALIADHIIDDQDTDDTNELIDLTFTKLTNTLSISQSATPVGASVDLSGLVGSDDQQLTLEDNILSLEEGGDDIVLTTYLDNTDEQQLSFDGTTVSLTDGGSFDLPAATVNTDNQQISINLAGTEITLERGGTIPLPAAAVEADGVVGNEVTGVTNTTLELSGSGTNADPLTLGVTPGGIGTTELSNNAVNTNKIINGTILAEDLNQMGAANNQILKWNGTIWAPAADEGGITYLDGNGLTLNGTTFNVDDLQGEVTGATNATVIADNVVTSAKISNATILAEDLNQMGATNNQILKWNGTIWAPSADEGGITYLDGNGLTLTGSTFNVDDLQGDVTGSTNTTVIAANAINSNKIAQGTILLEDLNQNGALEGQVIKWDDTTGGWIVSDDRTDGTGIPTLADTAILIGDTANLPQERIISGDAKIDNTGLLTISDNAVTPPKMAPGTAAGQLLQWDGNDWVYITEADITVTEVDGIIGNEVT